MAGSLNIECLEREIQVVQSAPGSHAFHDEETATIYGSYGVPLQQFFCLSGHLEKTSEGRQWMQNYQRYCRELYQSKEFVPQHIYLKLAPQMFKKLLYIADPVVEVQNTKEQAKLQSTARITSLDEILAAFIKLIFTKAKTEDPADVLSFHERKGYVVDANGIKCQYSLEKTHKKRAAISDEYLLGRVLPHQIRSGHNWFDRLEKWFEGNPALKLKPPLDHWAEFSLLPLQPNFGTRRAPFIRVKFAP